MTVVEQLGHGGIKSLRKLQEGYELDSSATTASLAALTCVATSSSTHSKPVPTATALDSLKAAPYLTDLEEWLQWSIAAQPTLGPLYTFLQQHGMLLQFCAASSVHAVCMLRDYGVHYTAVGRT